MTVFWKEFVKVWKYFQNFIENFDSCKGNFNKTLEKFDETLNFLRLLSFIAAESWAVIHHLQIIFGKFWGGLSFFLHTGVAIGINIYLWVQSVLNFTNLNQIWSYSHN